MKSVNFAILGEQSIANEFGKKGTVTDLTLFDRKDSDIIRTWVVPIGFPDKIQPLFQAINLAEYVIFYFGTLDKFTGEQIVALDLLKKREGVISHTYEVDENQLLSMIKGTVLEKYKRVNSSEIASYINKLEPISNSGPAQIVIDHCFDVKGVGTVVLGKILQGKIKQYDTLKLLPRGIDVTIKSIQMHDNPVEGAISPARVGLSIKGAKVTEISRGDCLVQDDSIQIQSELSLDFSQNPFYKTKLLENQMCLVNKGLQIKAGKFSSINPMKITLDKQVVVIGNEPFIILKPDSPSIRIVGSGKILSN